MVNRNLLMWNSETTKSYTDIQCLYEWCWQIRSDSFNSKFTKKLCAMVEDFILSLDRNRNREQFYYFSRMPESRTKHQGLLQRPANYSLLSFREELVRNVLELEEYSNPPVYRNFKQKDLTVFNTAHIPVFWKTKRT